MTDGKRRQRKRPKLLQDSPKKGEKMIPEFERSTGSVSRELVSEEAMDLSQDRFGNGTELVCMKYSFLFLVHATVFSLYQSMGHKCSAR
jgi:hypothetical protein